MARLIVYLPGLQPGAFALPSQPGWRRLLARADWRASPLSCLSSLLQVFGAGSPAPVADLCAAHDFDDPAAQGWLRADPVAISTDPRLALLTAPTLGELSAAEAATCLTGLRAAMSERDWRQGRCPTRWYVRADGIGPGSPVGPAWIHGRSISPFLLQGDAARAWRVFFNDAQMALHAAAPDFGVNAVWPWGGGERAGLRPMACRLVGNDVLLAGLARALEIPWSLALSSGAPPEIDVHLLVGAPWGAAEPAQPVLEANRFVEELAPLLWGWLTEKRLERIELVGEHCVGRLVPNARWRCWRRLPRHGLGDPFPVATP